MTAESVRAIAFYLPQFHPIPENDAWWGKGFTEWSNVVKAKPLFHGHYQPHLPADLGFYDLRLSETREAQANLARQYGIAGFCYYHYWFAGKRLLHRPFDEVLASGSPDFPFCLCWANENWTRIWDGGDSEVLMKQTYSDEDDLAHIRWLAQAFADPRYIRVENRPLFIIYRAYKLPDIRKTTAVWREECRRLGIGEIFLCRIDTASDTVLPSEAGLDAAVEFQPDWGSLGPFVGSRLRKRFHLDDWRFFMKRKLLGDDTRVYDYAELVETMSRRPLPCYPRFPCVTPSWDNSARRRRGAAVFLGSTPELFERWLTATLCRAVESDSPPPIVFINAWNEWAEGNHLEPDQQYGRLYLETVRGAVSSVHRSTKNDNGSNIRSPAVSVVIPTYSHAATVLQTLDSVFAQTFTDYEVIVVNDGSPDETAQLLGPLAASGRIRYFEQSNKGQAAARNRGLAEAAGEFIAFLDDDDLWPTDKLEWQVAYLEKDPSIAAIGGGCELIGDSVAAATAGVFYEGVVTAEMVSRGNPFLSPGQTLIRTQVLREIGGFDPSLWGADDMDLWFRMALKAKIVALRQTALQYRLHEQNASRDAIRMYVNGFRMIHKHLRLVPAGILDAIRKNYYVWLYNYLGPRIVRSLIKRSPAPFQGRDIKNKPNLTLVLTSLITAPTLGWLFVRGTIIAAMRKVIRTLQAIARLAGIDIQRYRPSPPSGSSRR